MVFGGLQGLEAGVDADPNLEVAEPSVLFDLYVNTCPSQGSRTIRTEVSLPASRLQPPGCSQGSTASQGSVQAGVQLCPRLSQASLPWRWFPNGLGLSPP